MRFKIVVGDSIAYFAATVLPAFIALLAEASATPGTSPSEARVYPTKPVRILVTNSPGSGTDIMARLIGRKLTDDWGQQIVVDNRPGGGGNIGGELAAKATPDGYTLLLVTSSNAIANALFEKLKYELLRDFSPISLLASTPFVLVVHPSLTATSIRELVALAKSRPRELNYGSSGAGSGVHLAAEIFKTMSGSNFVHVPYKGLNPALTDLMGGQLQLAFAVVPAVLPMIKAGRVRALGVTSLKRTALAPDLPAISESVPGYEVIGWYGMVAPRQTPREIISKLNDELVKGFKTPAFQERLSALGAEPIGTTPHDFGSFMQTQIRKYRQAVRDSGMRVE